jgi:hypothetical protein
MAWRTIGNRAFYYLSARQRGTGKVRSQYLRGELGAMWAEVIALKREGQAAERQALAESREWGRHLDEATGPFLAAVRGFTGLVMLAVGYHRHDRGPWRRRRRTMSGDVPVTATAPLSASTILARAAKGDARVYDAAMALLDSPRGVGLIAGVFNLANLAKLALVNTVAGEDYLAQEAMMRGMEVAAASLAGPDPSPIERVLAERIAVDQFVVSRCELRAARIHGTMPQIEHEHRLLDRAHQRLLQSIKALAAVRKLAVPVLVGQLNVAAGAPLQVVNEAGGEA